jgi:hypothetical protein
MHDQPENAEVARHRRVARGPRRARHGLLDSLVGGASDVVETVAKDIAPGVVGVLDVDELVQQIDVQALLERVDLNALLARVDVQALVDRLDVGEIISKLDMNAVLANVDIDALVERTEIGSIVARSGAGVAAKVIDVARSHGVGLDSFLHRSVDRLLRRDGAAAPSGPPLLVQTATPSVS